MARQRVRGVADILNAGLWNRPGPDWKSVAEWAVVSKLGKSTTASRLEKLVAEGTWEKQQGGRTYYYRPKA